MAIYNADSNGHAPKNATVGDIINTKGGTFKITSGSNGNFKSVKITNDPIDKAIYDTLALEQSIADSNSARSQMYAREQMDFQSSQQRDMMEYNSAEAQKNRDFQMNMSNTAHQREVEDLKAAGLNPVLSANNGAAVTSGATASGTALSGASGSTDNTSNISGLASTIINAKLQEKLNRDNNLNQLKLGEMSAAAAMYGANQSAGASMYGALMGYNASVYGTDQNIAWQKENPSNPIQAFGKLVRDTPATVQSPYGSGVKRNDVVTIKGNVSNAVKSAAKLLGLGGKPHK